MLTNTKQRLHTAKWEGNGINGLIYILWGVKFLDLLEREIKPIRKKSEGKEKKPKSRNWWIRWTVFEECVSSENIDTFW